MASLAITGRIGLGSKSVYMDRLPKDTLASYKPFARIFHAFMVDGKRKATILILSRRHIEPPVVSTRAARGQIRATSNR